MPRGGKQPGAGRPLGRKNDRTLKQEAMWNAFIATFEPELQAVTKAVIKKGKDGDITAAKELYDRALGSIASQQDPTGGSLPTPIININVISADDSDKKTGQIIEATEDSGGGNGGVQDGEHTALIDQLCPNGQEPDDNQRGIGDISAPIEGAVKDFLQILKAHNYFKDNLWNKTEHIYTFETGSKIEFFSVDQPGKVRGPRRERLFINEANNVSYETFEQLEIRTSEFIFLDFNPTREFWVYDKAIADRDDAEWLTLTYKDNEALDKSVVEAIERRKGNKNWWRVYGLGLLGEIEAQIYTGWAILDDIPHEARLTRYGLNFGYTADPAAIVAVYYYNGGYILDQIAYAKGLSNKMIADILLNQPQALVIADAAEPKSIEEVRIYGVTILPCEKGQGSVLQGIQYVQSQKISITKRSIDLIKEYRNYIFITDKDGRMTNDPDVLYHYGMDAVRYAIASLKPNTEPDEQEIAERRLARLKQERANIR